MSNRNIKQLGHGRSAINKKNDIDLSVMKPFVKFGIGALGALAHTLIGIVKAIPKPHDDDDQRKPGTKIIKIS